MFNQSSKRNSRLASLMGATALALFLAGVPLGAPALAGPSVETGKAAVQAKPKVMRYFRYEWTHAPSFFAYEEVTLFSDGRVAFTYTVSNGRPPDQVAAAGTFALVSPHGEIAVFADRALTRKLDPKQGFSMGGSAHGSVERAGTVVGYIDPLQLATLTDVKFASSGKVTKYGLQELGKLLSFMAVIALYPTPLQAPLVLVK